MDLVPLSLVIVDIVNKQKTLQIEHRIIKNASWWENDQLPMRRSIGNHRAQI